MIKYYNWMRDVIENDTHTLIVGSSGSGKSVLLNDFLLYTLTTDYYWYLIDVKKVELSPYRNSTHCIAYADNIPSVISSLHNACDEIYRRLDVMQRQGIRKSREPKIFVVIDELADLMINYKKLVAPLLSEICTIGRASNVFLLACTQRPTMSVIPELIKVNCDCKIALRTASEQDSRNIIGVSDAHYLPRHGFCYVVHPMFDVPVKAPVNFNTDEEIAQMIAPTNKMRSSCTNSYTTRKPKKRNGLLEFFLN